MGIINTTPVKKFEPKLVSERNCDLPCVHCPTSQDRKAGNPGCFEDIHKKITDIKPQTFEGAKFIIRKALSNHFNVTHNIIMNSKTPGYTFDANYIGIKRVGLHEKYPMIKGSITPNGDLNASFIHTLGCRYRFKLNTEIEGRKCKSCTTALEYRSDNFTLGFTLENPDFIRERGTLILHYLQALSSRLTLATEVTLYNDFNNKTEKYKKIRGAFRYSTGYTTISATLEEKNFYLTLHRKLSRQLQLGAEFYIDAKAQKSVGSIIYQVDIPYADLVYRGFLNSECKLGAVLEKKLYPISDTSLTLSATLNHIRQEFIVGIGLNVG